MFSLSSVNPVSTAFATGACLLLSVCAVADQTRSEPVLAGQAQLEAMRTFLLGTWTAHIGQVKMDLRLGEDGRFRLDGREGTYSVEPNVLKLQSGPNQVAYGFTLADNKLTLSGGDLTQTMQFTKVPPLAEPGRWLFGASVSAVKTKLRDILVIILIVAFVHVILWALRSLMYFVIYGEQGPLKFIYRRHKKRTMTIYSLLLNVSKYVIYVWAIGYILTRFGVNYTVYLASLSVIGLAIGFGSQGLVQDMVTGFFIVFEEQFNVGDMVEIPPYVGIVEELGLRMTRLRNYVGQRVVIPNRNIGAVGNYLRGAQEVYIDVAAAQSTATTRALKTLEQIAEETARQFHDVILSTPEVPGELSLATGERFFRLYLSIWPQQQWVIDQELLPRIRALMKSHGIEIPNDRISVFYHPRESRPVPGRRPKEDSA